MRLDAFFTWTGGWDITRRDVLSPQQESWIATTRDGGPNASPTRRHPIQLQEHASVGQGSIPVQLGMLWLHV